MLYHHLSGKKFRPVLIMRPHSGVGAWAPRPKKLNDAIVRITPPISMDACTITGEMVLGRICLKIIFVVEVPMVLAAKTKLRSLRATACPRTIRVYQGHQEMAMARMALLRLGPRIATIAMARRSGGKLRKISVKRMMNSSTAPPTEPAMAPRGTPIKSASTTATTAVSRETRVP